MSGAASVALPFVKVSFARMSVGTSAAYAAVTMRRGSSTWQRGIAPMCCGGPATAIYLCLHDGAQGSLAADTVDTGEIVASAIELKYSFD